MTDPKRDALVAACERAAEAREFHEDRVEATQQALDDAQATYRDAVSANLSAIRKLYEYDREHMTVAEQLDVEVIRAFGGEWTADVMQGEGGWHGVARCGTHAVSVVDVPPTATPAEAEAAMLATLRAMPTKTS